MAVNTVLDRITVDESLPGALHEQLGAWIRRQIGEGALRPGDRLPSVREIAKRCGLSSFTVQRAMGDLTREGLIHGRRGAGTFVAEPRIRSTEVIFGHRPPRTWSALGPFYDQVFDGLRSAYDDPIRRLCATYVEGQAPSAAEILSVCAARNTDGIVTYRPTGDVADALRVVSHRVPTVSLLRPIANSAADCIGVDTTPVVRALVNARVAEGRREFIIAGFEHSMVDPKDESSPYHQIYETITETVAKAGARLTSHLHPSNGFDPPMPAESIQAWFAPRLADVARDAVIFAQNPHLVETAGLRERGLDIITYTESRATRDAFRNQLTLLYMGLERLSAEAAGRLRTVARDGEALTGDIVRLKPEVLTP